MKQAFVAMWKSPGFAPALAHLRELLRDPYLREAVEPPLVHPSFGRLTCDAKTRKGTPCQMTRIWPNGRCALHGGKSTGPLFKRDEIENPMTHARAQKGRP